MDNQAQPSTPSAPAGTPAQRWARATLLRPEATMRSPLLRAIVGVTQLHVADEYPNDAFAVAGQHLADQLYNVLVADEAGIHFAAAVLFQASATEAQRQPGTIQVAVASAALACVGALMNLARHEALNLPDCTVAGREILAKQRQAPAQSTTDPTPLQSEASSP